MINAYGRLVLITFGSLIVVFFGLFLMRQVGFSQSFAPPPHVWFEQKTWKFFEPEKEALCQHPELPEDWILKVPVRQTEHSWVVVCPEAPAVSDFLAKSNAKNILFLVYGIEVRGLETLVDAVLPFEKLKHFAAVSPSQVVIRSLRKQAPQWLFGADSATLLRLHLFRGFFLETALDFWPDFVIVSADPHSPQHLSPAEAEELLRRKKRLIADHTENSAHPLNIPTQGILTNRPEELR